MTLPSSPLLRDALLAAGLTLATQVELVLAAGRVEGPVVLQHVVFAVMTAAVALRRRQPLLAAVVAGGAMALQTLAGPAPVAGGFLALLVVVTSLGYHTTVRTGLVGLGAVLGGALLYDVVAGDFLLADLVVNVTIVLGCWGAGQLVRRSTEKRIAAELARDRFAREAVLEERSRIARDLHDSVAHALTLITLQAGGARERTQEPVVGDALATIEEGGRQALVDMHRFLRLLGEPGQGPAEAPGLQDLEDLADRVRASGMAVHLSGSGDMATLPPSISSTAYRVVQEALTNAAKHSGASAAFVSLERSGEELVVTVSDDGHLDARSARISVGSGRGLPSLRERLALFEGELTAAPHGEAGWRVQATIPVGS